MKTILYIICLIGCIVIGVVIDRLWLWKSKGKKDRVYVENPIPDDSLASVKADDPLIERYLSEWKVVIETQMHFNDLIIRFRSITLTAFISMTGAALTLLKMEIFVDNLLLLIPIVFWCTAGILDFCYYNRLLLGSVRQAKKFDQSKKMKELGLFGMTACIGSHVNSTATKFLVIAYYFFPVIAIIVIICLLERAS